MANKYSCIIIDDEPQASELLIDSLKILYPNIEVINTYTSSAAALNALRTTQCDLVMLDITMPGKNGLDLLKLAPDLKSEIIFITAHSEYALTAFKFSPTGYILKPIDDADIVQAVDKAIERIKYKKLAKQGTEINLSPKIGIPNNKGVDYVNVNDIIYFESVNKYTKVVLASKVFLSSYNLGKYKLLIEGHLFYQVHRSFIVNLNCISRYESTGVLIMSNKKEIPVSKNERENFLKIINTVSRLEEMG